MKDALRDLFTFSAGERRGTIILILVVIMISCFNLLLVRHHPAITREDYPEWMNDTGILTGLSDPVYTDRDTTPEIHPTFAGLHEKFFFDPNDATAEDLLRLGISPGICRTIIHYRLKGGRFDNPQDLLKIYGMSQALYSGISSYVRIRNTPDSMERKTVNIQQATDFLLDINHADSALLESLPGIGPVLANRIIKYRSLLGGYYSPGQIKEVYGISDSLFHKIVNRLAADTAVLKKINLNTATEKELARHPYIGKYAASGIIRYRLQVSNIRNINELKINGLMSDDVFNKVKNYLSI
jgi:competence protein ComEA